MKKLLTLTALLVLSGSAIYQDVRAQVLYNDAALFINNGASLYVGGDFTNTATANFNNNGTATITGNVTNDQVISSYTGKIIFNAGTTQTLSGAAAIFTKDFEINNAAGIILNTTLKADGTVTFINGIITAAAAITPLWFTANATHTGAADGAHVNGYVVKEGTGTFAYPVGDGARYQQVRVSATANATGIQVKYNPADAGAAPFGTTGASATPLLYYNTNEYWDIHPLSTATGTVTIYWDDYNNAGIANTAHLSVAHKSGAFWLNEGAAGLSGTITAGSVTSASLSNWSPFALGSINSLSTLPVRWLGISGSITTYKQALISWQVSELNVTTYQVEKSTDARQFVTIGRLNSKGDGNNSYSFTEADPFIVNTYYRIKQTDMDGRYTYSPVIRLQTTGAISDVIAVYPVPFTTGFTLTSNKAQKANLINARGQVLRKIHLGAGANYIHAAELGSGVYYLTTENGSTYKLVKQ
ncbi:MAG: T9SS type A sorting domain-containing protein [Chitinophagaceae bacterium]|nr:T9SS type A sorting domain-containing protein [Chitinophagaceae bacterium]